MSETPIEMVRAIADILGIAGDDKRAAELLDAWVDMKERRLRAEVQRLRANVQAALVICNTDHYCYGECVDIARALDPDNGLERYGKA